MQSCWRFLKTRADACWWFGTKRSVPVTKKLLFQTQHGVIHEPSLICVFTVSHTYCFLTRWIQRCYAWEFNRRESWAQTPHFYRSSRSSITHTIINTRCWTCGMEISSAHMGTNCRRLPPIKHFHLFYQALFYLLLKTAAIFSYRPLFSIVLHCSEWPRDLRVIFS